jgi:hypothetical protein
LRACFVPAIVPCCVNLFPINSQVHFTAYLPGVAFLALRLARPLRARAYGRLFETAALRCVTAVPPVAQDKPRQPATAV